MNIYFVIYIVSTFIIISETAKNRSIVDLTYTYNNEDTPTHPLNSKFQMKVVYDGLKMEKAKSLSFYSYDFTMAEHSGTHIDAPRHVGKMLESADEIPLEKVYKMPGVMIDVSEQVKSDHNYAIQRKDIDNWVEEYGDIPDGAIIIFRTGWGKKALDKKSYFGIDGNGNMNFPGIGADAAEWIVNYKNSSEKLVHGIVAVAIDTVSLDTAKDETWPAHEMILESGIYGIENAANTEELPPKDFTITMLPMKIGGGTGGPTRLMAEINGIHFTSFDSSAQMLIINPTASILMFLLSLSACLFI